MILSIARLWTGVLLLICARGLDLAGLARLSFRLAWLAGRVAGR